VLLLASVLIGILTVIPEEVRAQTKESLPSKLILAYPSSPENLKSSPGDGYVVLSWAAPSSDGGSAITVYLIYRGTSYGNEVLLDRVSASETFYTDKAVKNGQTYYYRVSAVNKEKEEGTSASTKATPISIVTKPSAPQKLQSAASDGYVYLKWIAPDDDGGSAIVEYRIYRGTSSDAESYLDSVSAPTTSYTDRTVTNDLIYYYKVSAENSVGEGEMSNEVDARPKSSLTQTTAPLVTTPSAPLNFKVSAGDGNVNLEWREPSDDGGSPITNYNIYRGTVSNVLSYTDDNVINDQRYYYQVSAENSAGEGKRSNEVSVEPKGDSLDTGMWITIIVAIIGALGVIIAALINYLSSKKTK
jgi:fibronectin type 3 domain-containing protein